MRAMTSTPRPTTQDSLFLESPFQNSASVSITVTVHGPGVCFPFSFVGIYPSLFSFYPCRGLASRQHSPLVASVYILLVPRFTDRAGSRNPNPKDQGQSKPKRQKKLIVFHSILPIQPAVEHGYFPKTSSATSTPFSRSASEISQSVTSPLGPVTCPLSPVTSPLSPVTSPLSPVTSPLSQVTCPLSPVT